MVLHEQITIKEYLEDSGMPLLAVTYLQPGQADVPNIEQ